MTTVVSSNLFDGPTDPRIGAMLHDMFTQYQEAVGPMSAEDIAEQVKSGAFHLESIPFLSFAVTTLAGACFNLQPASWRVDVEEQSSSGFTAVCRATVQGGEIVVGTVEVFIEEATVTGGYTRGVKLHLTPMASRPLWDKGDFFAAQSTPSYPAGTN